jgi:O-acetyl-ADP-ribose deacetylase (regulator of RNase III)
VLGLAERGRHVAPGEHEVRVHVAEDEQVEGGRAHPLSLSPRGAARAYDGSVEIALVEGDITRQAVDAVVNAANRSLLGGGGVDGAIHRAGGPAILAACEELRATTLPDGLPTGEAVATTAGDLPARWVIHTVGPIYGRDPEPATLLARCHTSCLRVADEIGAGTVAFPAISTGAYGYPMRQAAEVAVAAVRGAETRVETVHFVLIGADAVHAFTAALGD